MANAVQMLWEEGGPRSETLQHLARLGNGMVVTVDQMPYLGSDDTGVSYTDGMPPVSWRWQARARTREVASTEPNGDSLT